MEENNCLANIPYKTLEMIQEANEEDNILLALFKCLDEIKLQFKGVSSWQIVIFIEGKLYAQGTNGTDIHVYNVDKIKNLSKNKNYIFLLTNHSEYETAAFFDKIKNILILFKYDFKEISIKKQEINLFDIPIIKIIETYFGS